MMVGQLCPLFLLSLLTCLCFSGLSRAEADFVDVRVSLDKDRNMHNDDESGKYFAESNFHQHYDGRFASQKMKAEARLASLTTMMQAFLSTMADLGAETWIMHGTLLGWWWNGKLLPWDDDIDVQVTEQTMAFLAKFYNMTEYHFTSADDEEQGATYLLEINPNFTNGSTADKYNMIDARWIDTNNGIFIDISTVRPNQAARDQGVEGALIVKDRHHYLERDIFPLRDGYFEGFHVKIPFDYEWLLIEEYGRKALTQTNYEGHKFNQDTKLWEPMTRKEKSSHRKSGRKSGSRSRTDVGGRTGRGSRGHNGPG